MAVRLSKEPATPAAVTAVQGRVSSLEPGVSSEPVSERSPGTSQRRRFGRVALTIAFLAGALIAGLVGAAVASDRSNSAEAARAELARTRAELAQTRGELATAQQEGTSTQLELDSANDQLAQLQAKADDVTDRAATLYTQETEARRRTAELDKREQQVATREATVATREAALKSYDVGHPLLESIMDDGTWVVGRDIKPGTWRAFADDTGCTWKTSDGRSGQGDGTYRDMNVPLSVGQTFTVHGCMSWDNYGW